MGHIVKNCYIWVLITHLLIQLFLGYPLTNINLHICKIWK